MGSDIGSERFASQHDEERRYLFSTALLLRRKYLLWRCALACERLIHTGKTTRAWTPKRRRDVWRENTACQAGENSKKRNKR